MFSYFGMITSDWWQNLMGNMWTGRLTPAQVQDIKDSAELDIKRAGGDHSAIARVRAEIDKVVSLNGGTAADKIGGVLAGLRIPGLLNDQDSSTGAQVFHWILLLAVIAAVIWGVGKVAKVAL